MDYPSKLIEDAVNQVAKLPGIGKKTALRLVLHLIKNKEENTIALTEALNKLRSNIKFCASCHNISDSEVCFICASHKRDHRILCVVEDAKDVMAIENTSQYNGIYHVIGGVISPMNGVGPTDLKIESLVTRLNQVQCEIKEVILALSPTMEGSPRLNPITSIPFILNSRALAAMANVADSSIASIRFESLFMC